MGGSFLLPALSSLLGPGGGEGGGEGGISSFGSSACAGVSLVLPSAPMSGGGPIESSEALGGEGGISSFASSACAGVSLVLPCASMSGGGPIESSEAFFSLGGPDGGGLDGGGGLVASDSSEDGSGIGGGGLVGSSLPDISKLDIVYLCVCVYFICTSWTVHVRSNPFFDLTLS